MSLTQRQSVVRELHSLPLGQTAGEVLAHLTGGGGGCHRPRGERDAPAVRQVDGSYRRRRQGPAGESEDLAAAAGHLQQAAGLETAGGALPRGTLLLAG